MSHYALVINEVVRSTRLTPFTDSVHGAYEEVPDNVKCGFERVGGNWQKSAALLAKEAKEAEGAVQKANLINVYTAMFNGTGTTAERATRLEKSLCWVVRHNLNLVD
jgi:hypothetical protein